MSVFKRKFINFNGKYQFSNYLFIYYGLFDNIAYYYLTLHSIEW